MCIKHRILSKVEWGLVYMIAKDKDGFVTKETARRVFDGSLFEYLENRNRNQGGLKQIIAQWISVKWCSAEVLCINPNKASAELQMSQNVWEE